MKSKELVVILLFLISVASLSAQTYKTGVLVYGDGSAAIGAALQAAKSGAKTTLLIPHQQFYFTARTFPKNLSGMALCLVDTILKLAPDRVLPKNYNEILFKYCDTLKNLSVIKDIQIIGAERKKNYWYLSLNSKTIIKADEIIDATADGKLAALTKAKKNDSTKYFVPLIAPIVLNSAVHPSSSLALSTIGTLYSDASGTQPILFGSILAKDVDHLILAGKILEKNKQAMSTIPANINLGQAAGAIAAYGSFFKSNTKYLHQANLRMIQNELIDYHLAVFDLEDIDLKNKNWAAVQITLLSGLFPLTTLHQRWYFEPNQKVKIAEIKPALQKLYFKTSIWLEDHQIKDSISVQKAISFICFLGNKGYQLSYDRIQRAWDKTYGLGVFDPQKAITRLQFAALVKDYLQPFNVKINSDGSVRE